MSGEELGDDDEIEARPSAASRLSVVEERWCDGCGGELTELDDEEGSCRACGEMLDGPAVLAAPLQTTAKPAGALATFAQDAPGRSRGAPGRSGPRKPRRELSAEELAIREERQQRRLDVGRFCELLSATPPAGTADLPPLVERGPQDVTGARPSGVLAKLPRRSGTGGSGSGLWLREYHDDGFATGRARRYVSLIPVFYDNTPKLVRLRGAAIYEDEIDEVIGVLTAWKSGLNKKGNDQ